MSKAGQRHPRIHAAQTMGCIALVYGAVGPTDRTAAVDDDSIVAFTNRLAALRDRTVPLASEANLLDSLHFGWFDRPYARATLALLMKSLATLEREAHLRERGNGALLITQSEDIFAWADEAVDRVYEPRPDSGFRPHRLRVSGPDLAADDASAVLFGFVDAATTTRIDPEYGDFDLLSSMGFRVYARSSDPLQTRPFSKTLRERARALGVASVAVVASAGGSSLTPGTTGEADFVVQPMTLASLLAEPRQAAGNLHRAMAIVDLPVGESWSGHLARRGLARGVTARPRFFSDGWMPPNTVEDDPRGIAAAMWVDALEGQSLGLIRGWRDLRDGSVTPYSSLLTHPRRIETIAYTALDLLRLRDAVAPFQSPPALAVAVGPEAVDPEAPNAWADWTRPVWDALFMRRIRFDLVSSPVDETSLRDRYAVVFPLRRAEARDMVSLLATVEGLLAEAKVRPESVRAEVTHAERSGALYVRSARSSAGINYLALINLSRDRCRVALAGTDPPGDWRDLTADEPIRHLPASLVLEPWQVRLLRSNR